MIKIFNDIYKRLYNSKLVRDSAAYTLLNIVEKAIPFLILPIITRVLTKEEVGIYILYQAIVEILLPIMTLNLGSSVLVNYYKVDSEEFKKYFSNTLLLFIPFMFVTTLLLLVNSELMSGLINFPESWLGLLSIIVFSRFFTQLRLSIWRVKYNIKQYGLFTIGLSLLKNGLGLYLVLFMSYGWEGIVIGHLVGYGVFAVFSLLSFAKEKLYSLDIKKEYIKDAFHVGYPLALHKLGLWLGNAVNRIIIAGILGTAATGSYGVGATFAAIVTVLEDSFSKAFVPHLFERLKNISNKGKLSIVKLTYKVYAFLVLISLSFMVIGYYGIDIIFGSDYSDTKIFIIPLIIASLFKGLYKLHVNYIHFSKQTLHITRITVFTGLLNLILAYLMTIKFGIVGTAYSLLIINLIQYVLAFRAGNKLITLPWLYFKTKYV